MDDPPAPAELGTFRDRERGILLRRWRPIAPMAMSVMAAIEIAAWITPALAKGLDIIRAMEAALAIISPILRGNAWVSFSCVACRAG